MRGGCPGDGVGHPGGVSNTVPATYTLRWSWSDIFAWSATSAASRSDRGSSGGLEQLQPLALVCGQAIVALAGVGLGLADPVAKRLRMDSKITRDVGDRTAGLNANRTPRSLNSSGYFLGTGISRASLSARTEPGFEASAKPSVAHPGGKNPLPGAALAQWKEEWARPWCAAGTYSETARQRPLAAEPEWPGPE